MSRRKYSIPKKFVSPTYGEIEFEKIPEIMNDYYKRNKDLVGDDCMFNIVIGTDSQNFSDTKVVSVIVLQCEGHGGIYFYKVERVNRIQDVRQKLNYETGKSLEYADKLLEALSDKKYEALYDDMHFSIHVDAGKSENGKTKDLIPGIVGWIHGCGYDCSVKPESYAASSIADKISK